MKFFIDGVGNDNISDIVTNLIRGKLLEFTIDQYEIHIIPMTGTSSGVFWDPVISEWRKYSNIRQLIINNKKLLLVLNYILFYDKFYTYKKDYFVQYDILNYQKLEELKIRYSPL